MWGRRQQECRQRRVHRLAPKADCRPCKESKAVIDAIVGMHKQLSAATGGDPRLPPTWTKLRNLVTPHPLGGCNLGTGRDTGVVDHSGAVFGYDNPDK